MDTSNKIGTVINTLNLVTVSGRKNLEYLLGCIQALEHVARELEAKTNDDKAD